jgi:hypothetical protein
VERVLAEFGPDRVMFGGDWPVCTRAASLGQWVTALRQIVSERPEAEQRKLFHDNAARFYGVDQFENNGPAREATSPAAQLPAARTAPTETQPGGS